MLKGKLIKYKIKNGTEKAVYKGWDNITSIGIIVSKKENVNRSEIDKITKSANKHIEFLFLELDAKTPTFSDWNCFTSHEKNLIGLPKLKNKKIGSFNCVINCTLNNVFALSLITNIKPLLIVGRDNELNNNHVTITTNNADFNLTQFISDSFSYLKMINPK
ncbi:MAG: hypothetical protein JSU07_06195 [Bacteroidetes bacterium]|nr:hypothetical protein [Bacteroidota bacterium]